MRLQTIHIAHQNIIIIALNKIYTNNQVSKCRTVNFWPLRLATGFLKTTAFAAAHSMYTQLAHILARPQKPPHQRFIVQAGGFFSGIENPTTVQINIHSSGDSYENTCYSRPICSGENLSVK